MHSPSQAVFRELQVKRRKQAEVKHVTGMERRLEKID